MSSFKQGDISETELNYFLLENCDALLNEINELEKSMKTQIIINPMDLQSITQNVKRSVNLANTKCCGKEMEKTNQSYYTCLECGIVGEPELSEFNNQTFERIKDTNLKSKVIYKRINYFNDWIYQLQGNGELSNEILCQIEEKFIRNKLKINPQSVKRVLKELKLPKYYNSINHISNKLQGIPVIVLSHDIVNKLNKMFSAIQTPYEKNKGNRKNFISYPYVLYKFFEILELKEYYELCRMLDSREKLLEHDLIWKSICIDMDWEYFVTV